MFYMMEESVVGVRALKQNASAVIRRVEAGEVLTITDRGRPVAQMSPITDRGLAKLVEEGSARGPVADPHSFSSLTPGPSAKTSREIVDDIRGRW